MGSRHSKDKTTNVIICVSTPLLQTAWNEDEVECTNKQHLQDALTRIITAFQNDVDLELYVYTKKCLKEQRKVFERQNKSLLTDQPYGNCQIAITFRLFEEVTILLNQAENTNYETIKLHTNHLMGRVNALT